MKFKKEFLQGVVWDEEDVEIIEEKIIDTDRWTTRHSVVFRLDDKYYQTYYNQGATEQQDERPYEYDEDEIECDEVEPYEVAVIKYRKVKKGV